MASRDVASARFSACIIVVTIAVCLVTQKC